MAVNKPRQLARLKDRESLTIYDEPEDVDRATAEALSKPEVRAASIIQQFEGDTLDLTSLADELKSQTEAVQTGDMKRPEAILAAQAHTLDALFANLARRAATNMNGGYLETATAYMKLALKAQAQTVRTIEALGELKSPKHIAFVAQANISNGHQQVNNGNREQVGNKFLQTELSERGRNELYQNIRASRIASAANPAMEAMVEVNGPTDSRRQSQIQPECIQR